MTVKRQILIEEGSPDARDYFSKEAKKTIARLEKERDSAEASLAKIKANSDEKQREIDFKEEALTNIVKDLIDQYNFLQQYRTKLNKTSILYDKVREKLDLLLYYAEERDMQISELFMDVGTTRNLLMGTLKEYKLLPDKAAKKKTTKKKAKKKITKKKVKKK